MFLCSGAHNRACGAVWPPHGDPAHAPPGRSRRLTATSRLISCRNASAILESTCMHACQTFFTPSPPTSRLWSPILGIPRSPPHDGAQLTVSPRISAAPRRSLCLRWLCCWCACLCCPLRCWPCLRVPSSMVGPAAQYSWDCLNSRVFAYCTRRCGLRRTSLASDPTLSWGSTLQRSPGHRRGCRLASGISP
jgi:hypothetical protein